MWPLATRKPKTFNFRVHLVFDQNILITKKKNLKFNKVKTLKFQQFFVMKFDFFRSFNFDLKFLWNCSFFHCEKIMKFIWVLTNLEPEGQGHSTIMGVTLPLLLGSFHYIWLFTGGIELWITLYVLEWPMLWRITMIY